MKIKRNPKVQSARRANSNVARKANTDTTAQTVAAIGSTMRKLRIEQRITLQKLSEMTKISPSMISLVERGLSAPSIGSLILIANALNTTISELMPDGSNIENEVVVRSGSRPLIETAENLMRRILRQDHLNGVLVSITEYKPETGSSRIARGHTGFEYGYILDGQLTVEIDGTTYPLQPGDLISYSSRKAHRIWNYSTKKARALWFNIETD